MRTPFILFFLLTISYSICAQKTDYAVQVGAFGDKVSLKYFKIDGVYETVDVNDIYRYYIDASSREEAERIREKAMDAGYQYSRVVDFNELRKLCEAQCGYVAPKKTSNRITEGNDPNKQSIGDGPHYGKGDFIIDSLELLEFLRNNRELGIDSVALFEFFKKKRKFGITQADLFEFVRKHKGIRIDSAGVFVFGSKDGRLMVIDSADMFTFLRNKRGIDISEADLFEFFKQRRELGITEADLMEWLKNKRNIDISSADLFEFLRKNMIESIFFDYNSDDLNAKAKGELRKLAKLLSAHPKYRVQIQAHADDRGDDSYNMKLSRKRAETARRYLDKQGLPKSRIEIKYFGEERPIARNTLPDGTDSEEGRRLNRRIEVEVINPEGKTIKIVTDINVPDRLRLD